MVAFNTTTSMLFTVGQSYAGPALFCHLPDTSNPDGSVNTFRPHAILVADLNFAEVEAILPKIAAVLNDHWDDAS